MRNITIKYLTRILLACCFIFIKSENSMAQVNIKLLTEVSKSCQDDTKNPEYYKQMGFGDYVISNLVNSTRILDESLERCVFHRYHHSLVQSNIPWLGSSGEIVPGYPGSVAISLMALERMDEHDLYIDCIIDGDPSSDKCYYLTRSFPNSVAELPHGDKSITSSYFSSSGGLIHLSPKYIYRCPSCVIAINNISSDKELTKSFVQWFLKLDKNRRKLILSIIENDSEAISKRTKIGKESERAVEKYIEMRKKIREESQEHKRRELIGN